MNNFNPLNRYRNAERERAINTNAIYLKLVRFDLNQQFQRKKVLKKYQERIQRS